MGIVDDNAEAGSAFGSLATSRQASRTLRTQPMACSNFAFDAD